MIIVNCAAMEGRDLGEGWLEWIEGGGFRGWGGGLCLADCRLAVEGSIP